MITKIIHRSSYWLAVVAMVCIFTVVISTVSDVTKRFTLGTSLQGSIEVSEILLVMLAFLALGIGPGAEIRAPMARAAIGGIISSTLLTLVVVPVVYTLIEDFFGLFRRSGQGIQTRVTEEQAVHE